VKQLVELHGGSVSAANRKRSTGAVFSVTLPLSGFDPSRAASFERAQPVSRSRSRVEGLEPAAALSGVRILVVEDDPDSREPLALLLAAHGAEVMAVESSARAMATFERQPPDVLISDIAIPDVDGYELLHRVRALPGERGGRVPAIALTAHARADDVSRAIESGYQVHIAKPYDGGHLVSVIGHLLQRVPA
jgi:CheY-like chemotaxis protein